MASGDRRKFTYEPVNWKLTTSPLLAFTLLGVYTKPPFPTWIVKVAAETVVEIKASAETSLENMMWAKRMWLFFETRFLMSYIPFPKGE